MRSFCRICKNAEKYDLLHRRNISVEDAWNEFLEPLTQLNKTMSRNASAGISLTRILTLAAYKRAWRVLVEYAKRIRETSFTSHFSMDPAYIWCVALHHIYAGISKRSQRGGLENRLPKRHGGSNPSSCAIKINTIPRGWCLFLYHSHRGRTPFREAKRGVRIPQAQSKHWGTKYSRYLRREEMSVLIRTMWND